MSFCFGMLYYLSSLAPQYLTIIVLLFLQYINNSKNIWKYIFIKHFYLIIFMLTFFVISIISTIIVSYAFKHIASKTREGLYGVRLSNEVNPGFGVFFLNSFIPIIAMFPSINEAPAISFVMIILFQILIFTFYRISSDIIPNLPLALIGYNVYTLSKLQKCDLRIPKGHMTYIIGKSKWNHRHLYCDKNKRVISFKASDPNSIFAIIKNR